MLYLFLVLFAFCYSNKAECVNHLHTASAYWVESQAFGSHWNEVKSLQAAHFDSSNFTILSTSNVKAILDVYDYVFSPQCAILPHAASVLKILHHNLDSQGLLPKILALYVYDEPFINGCTLETVETGLALLKSVFPSIPTYITFARHCFDPEFPDPACRATKRGIPQNLDWIGFDWYMDHLEGCGGTNLADQFTCRIVGGVSKLANLAPTKKAVLIPDCLTLSFGEDVLLDLVHRYYLFGRTASNVVMLDFFLWSNVPNQFNGLVSMPSLRATVNAFSRQVDMECGNPSEIIPVFQYALPGKDLFYTSWVWNDYVKSGYVAQGAQFAIFHTSHPNVVPFFECEIKQQNTAGVAYNHWLTTSPTCDNIPHQGTPLILGGVFTEQAANTVPLWRYCSIAYPWYHLYTPYSGELPGLVREVIVAHVLPKEAL